MPSPNRTANEWRELVSDWQQSGLTADEFALKQGGMTAKRLRWWRWKLGEPPVLLPVEVRGGASPSSTSIGDESSTRIDVIGGERVRIRVTTGFDERLLRRVVAALEAP